MMKSIESRKLQITRIRKISTRMVGMTGVIPKRKLNIGQSRQDVEADL